MQEAASLIKLLCIPIFYAFQFGFLWLVLQLYNKFDEEINHFFLNIAFSILLISHTASVVLFFILAFSLLN